MPNIKSAIKSVKTTAKKNAENKKIKTELKMQLKKINLLIKEGNKEEAKALLPEVFSTIDGACTKGILHKNNAANKKSKIAKKVDALGE